MGYTCDIIASNQKAGIITMKLIIAGLGPGNTGLLTLSALNAAKCADLILVPRSAPEHKGVAEKILAHHLPDTDFQHIVFPMILDPEIRSQRILSQLTDLRTKWESVSCIFFPVIGDSTLYSTAAYLLEAFEVLGVSVETQFIPGISAHSLAASCAKRFMAQGQDILTIIPGTAEPQRIRHALNACDCAAIYKPTALRNIHELAQDFGKVIRVDFAGIPELERIIHGTEALENIHEYLSVILLWRNS